MQVFPTPSYSFRLERGLKSRTAAAELHRAQTKPGVGIVAKGEEGCTSALGGHLARPTSGKEKGGCEVTNLMAIHQWHKKTVFNEVPTFSPRW